MVFSRSQIKKAGKILKEKEKFSGEEVGFVVNALTYWRTIHEKVLTDFYKIVSLEVERINNQAYVVQRLKRSPSIMAKLKRLPNTQLTTMQDIVGIRAIMKNLTEVESLRKRLKEALRNHEFKKSDNYINDPKEDGYRSIHLIYKYKNPHDRDTDGLLIEIQIRTELQHSWATAVETMSTFLGTHLKFGEGLPKWKTYFALTSNAFSFLEGTPKVSKYSHLSRKETYRQAIYDYNYLGIKESLSGFTGAVDVITSKRLKNDIYHLVMLDIKGSVTTITSYPKEQFEQANEDYTKLERKYSKDKKFEIVLVSTESINELKNAFPNYFLDTVKFLANMEKIKKEYNLIK